MNSIDILEECLAISYKMRKSSILSRKHKLKNSFKDKHTFKRDDKVIPIGKYTHPKHYCVIIEILPNGRYRCLWFVLVF